MAANPSSNRRRHLPGRAGDDDSPCCRFSVDSRSSTVLCARACAPLWVDRHLSPGRRGACYVLGLFDRPLKVRRLVLDHLVPSWRRVLWLSVLLHSPRTSRDQADRDFFRLAMEASGTPRTAPRQPGRETCVEKFVVVISAHNKNLSGARRSAFGVTETEVWDDTPVSDSMLVAAWPSGISTATVTYRNSRRFAPPRRTTLDAGRRRADTFASCLVGRVTPLPEKTRSARRFSARSSAPTIASRRSISRACPGSS